MNQSAEIHTLICSSDGSLCVSGVVVVVVVGHGEGTQVRSDDRRWDSQARSFIKVTEVTTRLVKMDGAGGGGRVGGGMSHLSIFHCLLVIHKS